LEVGIKVAALGERNEQRAERIVERWVVALRRLTGKNSVLIFQHGQLTRLLQIVGIKEMGGFVRRLERRG
jgi:hypothetical protein